MIRIRDMVKIRILYHGSGKGKGRGRAGGCHQRSFVLLANRANCLFRVGRCALRNPSPFSLLFKQTLTHP